MEMAKEVRAIMLARAFTGISAILSGAFGNSGKLSRDIPAIRVRKRPQVMLTH